MEGSKNKFSGLNERLIDFAVIIIRIVEGLPPTKAGNHLAGQLIRSGTSPALNYGEAQSGESRADFIHKLKVVLKELRETINCLTIIAKAKMFSETDYLKSAIKENDELISIFVKSVITAQNNNTKNNKEMQNKEQGVLNEEQQMP